MSKLKVCLAQMKVEPGQPEINGKKMLEIIGKVGNEADIVVFPEMCVPGYLIGDMWERLGFIQQCMDQDNLILNISKKYPDLLIVYGNVMVSDGNNKDGRQRKHNAAYAVKNGVATTSIKSLQPNYREFDDDRHFYSWMNHDFYGDFVEDVANTENFSYGMVEYQNIVSHKGVNIACILCEDGWDDDYGFSPIKNHVLWNDAELIINISCSPFTRGKNSKRNRVFGSKARQNKVPIIYVNNVGTQNNGKNVFAFDGNSCIYDKNGNQINPYMPFNEGCDSIIEIDMDDSFGSEQEPEDDMFMTYFAIKSATRDFMEQLNIKKVVIGVSGGIDSCLAAAIFHEIVGKENLTLVNMPSKFNTNTTKDIAKKLADRIGSRYLVIPIQEHVDNLVKQMSQHGEVTSFAIENIQARHRSSGVLAAVSAMVGGVFTCNANKTETTVGYATLYGDVGGFLAILGDLWKTEVYEMSRWFNQNVRNFIPEEALTVKPSAELSDNQNVEKNLGDPLIYEYHDKLFSSWVEKWNRDSIEETLYLYHYGLLGKEIGYKGNVEDLFPTNKQFIDDLEKWWNLYNGLAIAKRIQAPPIVTVSRRAFGFDLREAQVNVAGSYSDKYKKLKTQLLNEDVI